MRPGLSFWVAVLLVLATSVLYWPVRGFQFSHFDDLPYLVWNAHVRTGLSWENAGWAFTTFHQANWHPVTWLSHMADVEFHGLDPGGHHLTNLGFHLANTGLLFVLCSALTGTLWRSALVAALFAAHPLHVESVAWIAERKDVLSTFLLLAALGAYLRYARNPLRRRRAPVALLFGLALLAKPMVVTAPFALLLLDWWPLGRFGHGPAASGSRSAARRGLDLVSEKLPLFAMATAVSVVTLLAQSRGGALQTAEMIPPGQRLGNAIASYGAYLAKTAWPSGLSPRYPFPEGGPPAWKVAASLAALAAISASVVRWRRTRPAAITGWLWYLGTLVPVIGIVQVGSQALADRYTYLPLVGVFVGAVWSLGDAAARSRRTRLLAVAAAVPLLAALAVTARAQLGWWRDATTLNERVQSVTGDDWGALMQKAGRHEAHGELGEAEAAYRRALAIRPGHPVALNNLGVVLSERGSRAEGLALVEEAVRAKPDYAEAFFNLGVLLGNQGRRAEARLPLAEAVRLKPDFQEAQDLLRKVEASLKER